MHTTNTGNVIDFPRQNNLIGEMYQGARYKAGACKNFLATNEDVYQEFAKMIVQECIYLFGVTRTEPSLEKFIFDRLGVKYE